MKRYWLAAIISAAGLVLGCSQASESTDSAPGLDALRTALEERDELERKYLLTSFLRTLRPEDARPALEEFEKHRTGIEPEEVRLLMLAWTRFDGPGAFATARDWPSRWKSTLMEETMRAWGFNDGRAALAASEKVEDEELRESLRQAVVTGWVMSRDRLGATEYAATVSDPKRRSRLALRLAGYAKRDGPEAVIAWADAVPEDAPNDFKATVFSFAAGAVARLDPEHVAPWYEARMKHAYTRKALRIIAYKWAEFHDPRAAVAWIESLPVQEDREAERGEASRAAFRTWAAEAPEEVEAWIETASAGSTRDGAIEEYTRVIVDASPDEALRWAGQIQDEEVRRRRTLRYTRKWFVTDPDAARAWIDAADVPPEWRDQILNNFPQAKRHDAAKKAQPDG
jgi:hypothetical protein